jgi:hypothetical protein
MLATTRGSAPHTYCEVISSVIAIAQNPSQSTGLQATRTCPDNGGKSELFRGGNYVPDYTAFRLRHPEDGNSRFLREFTNNLPNYTASHTRNPEDVVSRYLGNVQRSTTLHGVTPAAVRTYGGPCCLVQSPSDPEAASSSRSIAIYRGLLRPASFILKSLMCYQNG